MRRPPLRAVLYMLVLLTAAVAVAAGGTSLSAFTGSIRNGKNTVTMGYSTCRAAQLADRPTRLYTLSDATAGKKNLGSLGSPADATLYGLLTVFPNGGGCARDPQTYFDLSPAIAGLAARWVGTGGTTTITASTTVTQEAWVKATSKGLIMGFGNVPGVLGPSKKTALEVSLTDSGQIDFTSGANHLTTPNGTDYSDGSWHHVVAVYDHGAKTLYVDGARSASASSQPSTTVSDVSWYLGHSPDLLGLLGSYLTGGVQYAATYDKALTAAQVRAHYLAGAGR